MLAELLLQQPLGLDIETTGLDPLQHRIRLLQLACRSGRVVVFDLFRLPAALFAPLSKARLVAHNAVFEYAFLAAAGIRLELLHDSMLMYRTLYGHTASLQDAAQEVLLLPLDKAEQVSDWTAPELTERQLRYAALDAWAALQLGEALGAGRTATYQLAVQALPVVAQCHLDGVPFDWPQHAVLCERWQQRSDRGRTGAAAAAGHRQPAQHQADRRLAAAESGRCHAGRVAAHRHRQAAAGPRRADRTHRRTRCWDRWRGSARCRSC